MYSNKVCILFMYYLLIIHTIDAIMIFGYFSKHNQSDQLNSCRTSFPLLWTSFHRSVNGSFEWHVVLMLRSLCFRNIYFLFTRLTCPRISHNPTAVKLHKSSSWNVEKRRPSGERKVPRWNAQHTPQHTPSICRETRRLRYTRLNLNGRWRPYLDV